MKRESMIVGGCTFNRWRYATWPLVSAGVEERGFRVGARAWPILRFGFFDVSRSLIQFSREDRSVLIPWESVRRIELRRPRQLLLTMVNGWTFRFSSNSESLKGMVEEAQSHLSGPSEGSRDA